MIPPRSRLLSVVLLVPVLLAWFEGKGPHPVPSAAPASAAPSTPPVPALPSVAPSTPAPSVPAPSTPAPSAPAPSTPAPSTPAPSTPAPSAPASASPAAPASPAPASAAPSPAPSPASGRKPSGTPGMATLQGHTFEMVDGKLQPVNKSEIMIPELQLETFSKPNGSFTIKHIPVREKPYEIMIIHPGFENLYEKRVFDKEERFKYDFTIKRKGF